MGLVLSSTTTSTPWARFVMRSRALAAVSVPFKVAGVSKRMCRVLTQAITSEMISSGMSWGITTSPPRLATVSAMRRPAIAVMLATTIGIVVPVPSSVAKSTSMRLAIWV